MTPFFGKPKQPTHPVDIRSEIISMGLHRLKALPPVNYTTWYLENVAGINKATDTFAPQALIFESHDPDCFFDYEGGNVFYGQDAAKEVILLDLATLPDDGRLKYLFSGPAGCVDGPTEYLSPTGWRRIDEYDGGLVAQCMPDGTAEFVKPSEYIKGPCDIAFEFSPARGMHQIISPEHRFVYRTKKNKVWKEQRAWEVAEDWVRDRGNAERYIPTAVVMSHGEGLPLSEVELRIQIAVIADGHFPNNTKRVTINLKKERKIHRIRQLLKEAGWEFYERQSSGYTRFSFTAPRRDKEFTEEYWTANPAQREAVCDEIWRWDGQ
jgi:hypothetical protein